MLLAAVCRLRLHWCKGPSGGRDNRSQPLKSDANLRVGLWVQSHKTNQAIDIPVKLATFGGHSLSAATFCVQQKVMFADIAKLAAGNLYSITKGQAAIVAFTRAMRDKTGNLPPLPGIFPDYKAPIVRNAPDGVRELAMARWGMPGPAIFGGASSPEVACYDTSRSYCLGVSRSWSNGSWFKVGKAAPTSQTRHTSQHYNPARAVSRFAASLMCDAGKGRAGG